MKKMFLKTEEFIIPRILRQTYIIIDNFLEWLPIKAFFRNFIQNYIIVELLLNSQSQNKQIKSSYDS